MNDNKKTTNKTRWKKIGLSVLCVFLALVLLLMIAATVADSYLDHYWGKTNYVDMNQEETNPVPPDETDPSFTGPMMDPTDVQHNTVPSESLQNDADIINILLVGQDRRPGEGRQRSDSMILCSFNVKKGTISMVSFLRDTYVYIPGWGSEKLNAAYAHGGFSCLFETLAVNFGVHVDAGIEVDFSGFKNIIDLLGGVSIKLTQKEVNHLNEKYGWQLSVGVNHLDGEKALAYSRIRKIDMDAMRAQRQRTVLLTLIENYKNKSLGEMLSLLEEILPLITTTMKADEIKGYLYDLFPMLSGITITTQQIPAAGTYKDMTVGKVTATKVADMDENRQILKKLLGY